MAELADALDLGSSAARHEGSSPSVPTGKKQREIAQLASALALGARGRGFKSRSPYWPPYMWQIIKDCKALALVAQWIEHRPSKPFVVGSNPARGA